MTIKNAVFWDVAPCCEPTFLRNVDIPEDGILQIYLPCLTRYKGTRVCLSSIGCLQLSAEFPAM
jgi:hypothetical protein